MALAKYAEEIQEAIYERIAMREYESTYDFKVTSGENVENRTIQKKGKIYENVLSVSNQLNPPFGKEAFYV